jgi:hypothetical protein
VSTEVSKRGGIGRDHADSCSAVDHREAGSTLKSERENWLIRVDALDKMEGDLKYMFGYV